MSFGKSDTYLDSRNLVRSRIGNITADLVLSAVIPLKDAVIISESHAETLARHVELYLQQNPEEIFLIESALDDQSLQMALDFEMMLEYDQQIRTVLLRAISVIASRNDAEFIAGVDRSRLTSLVASLETYPSKIHFLDGGNYSRA